MLFKQIENHKSDFADKDISGKGTVIICACVATVLFLVLLYFLYPYGEEIISKSKEEIYTDVYNNFTVKKYKDDIRFCGKTYDSNNTIMANARYNWGILEHGIKGDSDEIVFFDKNACYNESEKYSADYYYFSYLEPDTRFAYYRNCILLGENAENNKGEKFDYEHFTLKSIDSISNEVYDDLAEHNERVIFLYIQAISNAIFVAAGLVLLFVIFKEWEIDEKFKKGS